MIAALLADAVPTHVQTLRFNANVVSFVLTLLIPVVVAFITKAALPSRWKAVITLVLSAAVSLITMNRLADGTAVFSLQTLYEWSLTTAIAVVSYLGLWQPVGQVSERLAPKAGIGPSRG